MTGTAADLDVIFFIHVKHHIGSDEAADQRSELSRGHGRLHRRFHPGGNPNFQIGRGERQRPLFRLNHHVAENRQHGTRTDDAPHFLESFLQFFAVNGKFHFSCLPKPICCSSSYIY